MFNAQYYRFYSAGNAHRRLKQSQLPLLLKRVIEVTVSLAFLIVGTPFWILAMFRPGERRECSIYSQVAGRKIHTRESVKCDQELDFYNLQASGFVNRLPLFLRVIKGELSLVGAAPVESDADVPLYVTLGINPGIFSTYSLKRQANLTTLDRDYELLTYINTASLKTDLGIFVRSLIGHLFHAGEKSKPDQIQMLDILIDNMKIDPALSWILDQSRNHERCSQLAFANPDCFNIAQRNSDYKRVLQNADHLFADGIGVHIGCGMLNVAMHDNLNGTDLFPRICELAQAESLSLYLLGGKPGVTDAMIDKLSLAYPKLNIAGHQHGYFDASQEQEVIARINHSGADILLVAFGAPKQELWIDQHKATLKVGLAMGVGGLFDFVSERIPRAPLWMREIGLEWTYRLYQEPGRMWRRYIIGNPLFLYRIWKQKQSNRLEGAKR